MIMALYLIFPSVAYTYRFLHVSRKEHKGVLEKARSSYAGKDEAEKKLGENYIWCICLIPIAVVPERRFPRSFQNKIAH